MQRPEEDSELPRRLAARASPGYIPARPLFQITHLNLQISDATNRNLNPIFPKIFNYQRYYMNHLSTSSISLHQDATRREKYAF